MVGSLPGFFTGVGDQEGDTGMLFVFFIAFLAIFNNSTISEIPFVWGAAIFVSIGGALMNFAIGTGFGLILVPVLFAVFAKGYFPALTDFFGPGLMAFICVAFFAVAAGV
ncbi:MAG: hypothetical protein V1881_04245 [Candidatus Micrarchaeota archaeon]